MRTQVSRGRSTAPKVGSAASVEALSGRSRAWFGIALALVAANLRPAITSLPPLLPEISHAYRLSPATSSLLVAVPVLVLGAGSPLAAILARRLGLTGAIDAGLVLISGGIAVRSLSVSAMFPGTVIAAVGITIVAVLLPAFIACSDPASTGIWTSTYALAMALGAALAPAVSGLLATMGVPLSMSLLLWAVLPLVAVATRTKVRGRPSRATQSANEAMRWRGLVVQPAVLALTGFFLLQAMLFFAVVTWLPVYARSLGESAAMAGLTLGTFSGVGMVSAWCVPVLASGARSRVPLAAALCGCGAIGFALLGGGAPLLWGLAFLALGQGGAFPLALVLIPLKSNDTHAATALSTVVQGIGFTGAGCGLAGLAFLRSEIGAWPTLWWLLAAAALTQTMLACCAARPGQVTMTERRPHNPCRTLQESAP